MEQINFEELKTKLKIEQKKRQIKENALKFAYWAADNKEIVIGVGTLILGGARLGYKQHKQNREDRIRERRFYDPRKGRYSEARRNLSKKELGEIERRYDNGESYRSILDDMGLLK